MQSLLVPKNGLKTDRSFFTSGSLGLELKFAANALLFWSAILFLPSD